MEEKEVKEIFTNFEFSSVTLPTNSSKIYKSECVLSFHTPKMKKGIFVCLKTFLSFGSMYLDDYVKFSGNSIFLNIKEVPSEKKIDEKEVKKQTVKFGEQEVEVTTHEDEQFEQLLSLVFYKQDKVIPLPNKYLPLKVSQCIQLILEKDSEKKKMEIITVQEKLFPSKFSESIKKIKENVKLSKSNWKCSECEKTDNLWLNLSDGHIGCGRRNYDGSGGNNHGVDHYTKTGYPLVVKLGTITPKGADVYSYAEKKMVIDKLLDEHLKWYGIDMKEMKKTDKTMDELSLDISLNMELLSVLESGEHSSPVFGPGLTGLYNIGNTCYLNSLMQVMFSIEEFRKKYFDIKFSRYFSKDNKKMDPSEDLDFQLTKLCNGLCSGEYSKPSESQKRFFEKKKIEYKDKDVNLDREIGQDGIKPTVFKSLIGKNHQDFSSFHQQDPSELFLHIMKLIERVESFKEKSVDPTMLFKFLTEERIKCQKSPKVSIKETEEKMLSLQVKTDLARNLPAYMKYEKIRKEQEKKEEIEKQRMLLEEAKRKKNIAEGKITENKEEDVIIIGEKKKSDEKKVPPVRPRISMANLINSISFIEYIHDYYSEDLKSKTTAEKTIGIKTFPEYLCVKLLKYYYSESWVPKKLDVFVEAPQEIDISKTRAIGKLENEELIKVEKPKLNIDMKIVNDLVNLGFPVNGCKRAVVATNNAGTQEAANWILQNQSTPTFNLPLEEEIEKKEDIKEPPPEIVTQVTNLGIPKEYAIFSLKKTLNNPNRAIDYYFNHQTQIPLLISQARLEVQKKVTVPKKKVYSDGNGKYALFAFISHIGANVQSGHYVAHIMDQQTGKWYIFNDSRVKESKKTPFDRGYLYFYRRK